MGKRIREDASDGMGGELSVVMLPRPLTLVGRHDLCRCQEQERALRSWARVEGGRQQKRERERGVLMCRIRVDSCDLVDGER